MEEHCVLHLPERDLYQKVLSSSFSFDIMPGKCIGLESEIENW